MFCNNALYDIPESKTIERIKLSVAHSGSLRKRGWISEQPKHRELWGSGDFGWYGLTIQILLYMVTEQLRKWLADRKS